MQEVIIIDDDTDDIELLSEAIREVAPSLNPISFSVPREAIDFLRIPENAPSCIFLDINMPGIDGFECLEIIRDQPFFKDCLIVVLSTGMSADIKKELKGRGARFAFKKPHTFESYKSFVSKVVAALRANEITTNHAK
jgi:CheY-like chemotaxis protein